MSRPSEYLLPEKAVTIVEQANPPLYALRLFHACYCYMDRDPRLAIEYMSLGGDRACHALCCELNAITGTPGSNDNTMILNGISALQDIRLFETLRLSDCGRVVIFQIARKLAAEARRSKGDKFAMVDADEIGALGSPAQILFYTRAVMAERANHLSFYLPNCDFKR